MPVRVRSSHWPLGDMSQLVLKQQRKISLQTDDKDRADLIIGISHIHTQVNGTGRAMSPLHAPINGRLIL
jgi:hypothetical protein